MKTLKKFLVLTMALVMLMGCFTANAADMSGKLIGYWDFDGNITNKVTGVDATVTGNLVTQDVAAAFAALCPAYTADKTALDLNTFYGLKLDVAPTTDNYTISMDVSVDKVSQFTAMVFVCSDYADPALWASLGWGWYSGTDFTPGVWAHNAQTLPSETWVDYFKTAPLQLKQYYNVTWVAKDGEWSLYVDGVAMTDEEMYINAAVGKNSGNIINDKTFISLGVNAWDGALDAQVASLAIYDTAFTAEDAAALATADNNPYTATAPANSSTATAAPADPSTPVVPSAGEVNYLAIAALAAVAAVAGIVVIDRKRLAK